MIYKYLVVLVSVLFFSCSSVRMKKSVREAGLDQVHTGGIMIEDLQTGKVLLEKNVNQFFMPASNLKLLTFLVANRYLKEKTPAFVYQEKADTLFFWGAGDPSFLHPKYSNQQLIDFLQTKNQVLIYSEEQSLKPLGNGWAWDDYPDNYSAEISTLPMFGNLASFSKTENTWTVSPTHFSNALIFTDKNVVARDRNENRFYINPSKKSFQTPFITSATLTTELLSGMLNKPIQFVAKPVPSTASIAYVTPLDSLLKPMMYFSDNMIAEQLLVQIGTERKQSQLVESVIANMQEESKEAFVKDIKWVDGSGLSRYNLMRPKDLVGVLKAIYQEMPAQRWQALLPEAGKTGTLKNMTLNHPNLSIWAKSGSFSNTYNLSGFAKTPKGKWVAFSIMSNLANQSISKSKAQIIQLLNQLAAF